MKITDLLEAPITTNIETKPTHRPMRGFKQDVRGRPRGNFSVVKPDPTDPHMVRKSSRQSKGPEYADEGFKAFISYLVKNKIENIHFPRVYDVKTIKGSDGYVVDTFRTEKLINYKDIPDDELDAYASRMMGTEDSSFYQLSSLILGKCEGRFAALPFTEQSLDDACKIVYKILSETPGAENDAGTFNLMFRRTPQGLQLVINDPIYIDERQLKPEPERDMSAEDDKLLRDLGV